MASDERGLADRRGRDVSRVRCRECGWVGLRAEVLTAPSPFRSDDLLTACPDCRFVSEPIEVCDEEGCDKNATCGWPSNKGYRRTCFDHMEKAG